MDVRRLLCHCSVYECHPQVSLYVRPCITRMELHWAGLLNEVSFILRRDKGGYTSLTSYLCTILTHTYKEEQKRCRLHWGRKSLKLMAGEWRWMATFSLTTLSRPTHDKNDRFVHIPFCFFHRRIARPMSKDLDFYGFYWQVGWASVKGAVLSLKVQTITAIKCYVSTIQKPSSALHSCSDNIFSLITTF